MKTKIAIFCVLLYYFWIALYASGGFNPNHNLCGFYNMLANSFLEGRTTLPIEPDPRLLALDDPYDEVKNFGLRLHDATLYKGKYYLYFGPIPVLLTYLPFRVIFHHDISEYLVALIFSYSCFFASLFLLLYLKKKYFSNISEWMIALCILVLGFANFIPYNLRRLTMYQVSIVSGLSFSLWAIFFLSIAFCRKEKPPYFLFALSSLFIGLSGGSRHMYLTEGIFLVVTLFLALIKMREVQIDFLKTSISLFFPYVLCLFALGWYNYARFENPFEFGFRYQLGVMNNLKDNLFTSENWLANLYFYLLHPLQVDNIFPYIHMHGFISNPDWLQMPTKLYKERIGGLFISNPFSLVSILGGIICLFSKPKDLRFPLLEFLLMCCQGLTNFLIIISLSSVIMRYITDFSTYFIFASIIIWFYIDSILKNRQRTIFKIFAIIAAVVSILVGLALGIQGC